MRTDQVQRWRTSAPSITFIFIGTVSHELRTPLTAIQGATGAMSAELRTMVEIAGHNCARLHRLINDMLDVKWLETGKLTLTVAPTNLGAFVAQAVEANQPFAASMDVSRHTCQPLPSVTIATDSERQIQVIDNLLTNALKFSPRNGTVDSAITCQDQIVRLKRDAQKGVRE